jgi:hypothetical protein
MRAGLFELRRNHWFKIAVAVLSAPVALYLFDWAGFEWRHSITGWVIFLSSDAGLTSFVDAVLAIAIILVKPRLGRK